MRKYLSAKIHGIRVTDKSVDYHGSVSVSAELMKAAGIHEYEQVAVINLANGNRWETYAIPAPDGAFTLNGGGARLGEVGDRCVVLTYVVADEYVPATVVYCDEENDIAETFSYENTGIR